MFTSGYVNTETILHFFNICYPFYILQAAKLNMYMLATLCSILCEVLIFVNTTMIKYKFSPFNGMVMLLKRILSNFGSLGHCLWQCPTVIQFYYWTALCRVQIMCKRKKNILDMGQLVILYNEKTCLTG